MSNKVPNACLPWLPQQVLLDRFYSYHQPIHIFDQHIISRYQKLVAVNLKIVPWTGRRRRWMVMIIGFLRIIWTLVFFPLNFREFHSVILSWILLYHLSWILFQILDFMKRFGWNHLFPLPILLLVLNRVYVLSCVLRPHLEIVILEELGPWLLSLGLLQIIHLDLSLFVVWA